MNFTDEERKSLRNILEVNLNVKKDERVFVITNDPETLPDQLKRKGRDLFLMARELYEIGKGFCDISLIVAPAVRMHGEEPGEEIWKGVLPEAYDEIVREGIWDRIQSKKASEVEGRVFEIVRRSSDRVDAVVAMTYFSTSHTLFRKVLNRSKGTRYASMPLFERYMLAGAMNVDYREIERISVAVRDKLEGARKIFIDAPNGTELEIYVEGRSFIADTGLLHNPGDFGNLPAGEVFVAPVEGFSRGKLVIEYGPEEGKLSSPVVVYIENGIGVRIKGEGRVRELLEKKFEEDDRCRNVAELGIGTNGGATHVENILEAEKILGTIHVAFGDNSSFGGKVNAPFHQDFVVFQPTVRVEKEGEIFYLHREGKLIIDS